MVIADGEVGDDLDRIGQPREDLFREVFGMAGHDGVRPLGRFDQRVFGEKRVLRIQAGVVIAFKPGVDGVRQAARDEYGRSLGCGVSHRVFLQIRVDLRYTMGS